MGLIGRLGREYPSLKPASKYLRTLFVTILDKMKLSLDNDVFIPIFPKQYVISIEMVRNAKLTESLHLQNARSTFFVLSAAILQRIKIISKFAELARNSS